MPPPHLTNPPPLTSSARAALSAFHCDLCSKGYSRQNEYDAHLTSYEHNHKQRLKDLKAMNRNMANEARPTKEKEKDGLIRIDIGGKKDGAGGGENKGKGAGGGGGFKKGGFKSAFGKVAVGEEVRVKVEGEEEVDLPKKQTEREEKGGAANVGKSANAMQESDTEDEGYECYDPRKPTGCSSACKGRA